MAMAVASESASGSRSERWCARSCAASRAIERSIGITVALDQKGRVAGEAAFFFEAAKFITKANRHAPEVREFIAGLPQEARDECAQVVGGIDPKSAHYIGDWLGEHRNVTFHYSEVHPDKAAHGDEEITLALTEAAELPGTVHFDEEMGSVRFWFADEVVAQWLPPDEKKPPTIIALREALMALVRFTQRAFAAYQAARPAGTFTERA